MTVKDLKEMLSEVPDEMSVIIPMNGMFDGAFVSPCLEESGEAELGIYMDEDDAKEAALLNKPTEEKHFVLVGCGFFGGHDGPPPEMN